MTVGPRPSHGPNLSTGRFGFAPRHPAAWARHRLAVLLALVLLPAVARGGPPYVTDDPEPVELRHFEVYLASIASRDSEGWTGTCPHLEVNYGTVHDLQLHVIVPVAYSAPTAGPSHIGMGDLELGVKFRFVHEGRVMPQIGTFPLVEAPTGSDAEDSGNGHLQAFLPVWFQKTLGAWTTYGGFGYLLYSGSRARDSWFIGWQAQRQLSSRLALGAEVFRITPKQAGSDTRFNLGLTLGLSGFHHLLLSAGRGIQGANRLQAYLAYQVTFGLPRRVVK